MFGSIFNSMADLYKLFVILFFTTTFLYSLRIFSLTTNPSRDFLTSILVVLFIGNKRFTTLLPLFSIFLSINLSSRPEYIFVSFLFLIQKISFLYLFH